ncbi:MAG: heavy metal-binding domain-containing protein [Bacteroidetes bacterium]|nr:heavy metal-binding domain-containing protein [Bacteroidota bacterium]MCL5024997.1 heavy metal-binding domain-containing protein [Chloroflexota bacterium]
MTTTAFELPGYRVVRNLGVVRGVTVRSRGLGGQITGFLRTLGGGKIHEYVQLCEETRAEGFDLMLEHADQMGANAIVGIRYDATELGNNMTEVLAYGTAVVVEPS